MEALFFLIPRAACLYAGAHQPPSFKSDPGAFYTYHISISITTPVVSALKNYFRVPGNILNRFWIQVAVSEVKRPLRGRFGSEAVIKL
jgi:hypothetical protein